MPWHGCPPTSERGAVADGRPTNCVSHCAASLSCSARCAATAFAPACDMPCCAIARPVPIARRLAEPMRADRRSRRIESSRMMFRGKARVYACAGQRRWGCVDRVAVSGVAPGTLASGRGHAFVLATTKVLPDSAGGAQRLGQPGFGSSNLSQVDDTRMTRRAEECIRVVLTYE